MAPIDIENLDIELDPEEDQDASKATVDVTVLVDNKEVELTVVQVKFVEQVFEHSVLSVTLAPDLAVSDSMSEGLSDSATYLKMIGKSIVIKFKSIDEYAVEGAERREFQGTIYDVSFDFKSNFVVQITLHGVSNTFKLDQANKNAAFYEEKRSAIAEKFIQEAGMNPDLVNSKVKEDYIYCYNETRWQFLKRWARSEGHWLYSDGDKLIIKSPSSGESATLTWGKDMGAMHTRVKTRGNKTIVRGWDYMKKEAIVGKAASSTELSSAAKNAHSESKKGLFAEESFQDIRLSGLANKDQFNAAAAAGTEGRISRLAECSGQCNVPGLKVGFIIKIDGSGAAWNSKYFVTRVEHVIKAGGYYNNFESLPLDVAHPEWEEPNPPINGFITGIVTNLDDPNKLGRVKVKFPTLDSNGQELESFWARISSQYAGEGRGIFFLPEVNDEVLCCFERGDIQRPVVIGSFWNGKDKPNMAGAADAAKDNNIKTIYSRSGHQITFSDEAGKESISIIDKSGGNLIVIDTKSQTISITSDKDVAVKAKQNISLKADGDVSIEGSNVNIKASQGFKAEGMKVDVKAKGSMNLEASGNAKLKGSMLDVDGGSMCNVKGGLIKLN